MTPKLLLTKIPHLDVIVLRQAEGHFFIATPNSFIIGRQGFIRLLEELLDRDIITAEDISSIMVRKGIKDKV